MTRAEALKLVTDWTSNKNLIKHMLAVEAQMRAIARALNEDEELYALAGLLHDADYESLKDEPEKHPSKIFPELEKRNVDPRIIGAIKAHAWGWQKEAPEPQSNLDWALYTCDDLSGFIIACALVKPDKKLASLTVDSILKKWPTKSFAAGVHRGNVELCEPKLNINLKNYMELCLKSLQEIAPELGL